ncbi:MAG: ABC transporter substrate-binding protein [Chloroflexi bacterium]|nr:ABC transporter substrate-binding protein [Chloroflexota bacterium]
MKGGFITISLGQYRSLDPHQETLNSSLDSAGLGLDGILQFDPQDPTDAKIIPDLAEKWEAVNDTTYVFTFRQGVKWHDGKPFTAEDAKFSLMRIKDPPTGVVSPRKDWFKEVGSIEATDAQTLKVTLKRPQAAFLSFVAAGWSVVVPKHLLESNQEAIKRTIVGTGPYKIKEIDFNVGATMERNPDYFAKDAVNLDAVKWIVVPPDPSVAIAAFRAKRLDYVGAQRTDLETIKKENPSVLVQAPPGLCITHVRLRQDKPPFNDLRVRQAISMAVDRDAIIKGAAQGRGELASPMPATGNWNIPAGDLAKMPGYSAAAKAADIAKAKQLMTEAGYASGIKSKMLIGEGVEFDNAGIIVAEQLKAIGFDIAMEKFDVGTVVDRYNKNDFEMGTYGACSTLDDPDDFLEIMYRTKGGRNYGLFSDSQVDDLLTKQSVQLKREERKATITQLNARIMELQPQILLYWWGSEYAFHPWVKGYLRHSSIYTNFRHVGTWVDPKAKS